MLHDREAASSRNIAVPYAYVPGRAMHEVRLQFSTDARSLLVLSKTAGFLRFDVETAREVLSLANGEGDADVHMPSRSVAFLKRRATFGLAKDHLVVRPLP